VNKEKAQMNAPANHLRHRRLLGTIIASMVLFAAAVGASPASAALGIESFKSDFIEEGGAPTLQAGAHPYESVNSFETNWAIKGGLPLPEAQFKDIVADLPVGVVGSPESTPKCPLADLAFIKFGVRPRCADSTAVGYIALTDGPFTFITVPVYNLDAGPGAPGRFGFNLVTTTVILNLSVRAGDHGVRGTVPDASQVLPLSGSKLVIWGTPGDPSHDALRGSCINEEGESIGTCPFQGPVKPLLRMPTSCTGPLQSNLELDFWSHPGETFLTSYLSQNEAEEPVGMEGCARVPFTPSFDLQPRSREAAKPTGLHLRIHLPQEETPQGVGESDLRNVKVTLPKGLALSTSSAGGLGACTAAQIDLQSNQPAQCPGDSEVGRVSVDTPLLDHELPGSVFLAKQFENPFNSLIAIYIAIEDPVSGVVVKLPGKVDPDPVTGQVTASFEDAPQIPFENFSFDFFGGPRAAVKMPDKCGTYTSEYELTPWSSTAPVKGTSSFTVDQNCDTGGFDPKLSGGTTSALAGTHAPLVMHLSRQDGEQNLDGIQFTLPKGLIATLAGVSLCEGADAVTGNCPANSRIGSVAAAAGSGPQPVWVPQPDKEPTAVYLSGPYKGAPYGAVIKTPAQVGPFDLGTVVTRAALFIDSTDAQATVKADPLPQILQGVPLEYRDIAVNIDRPNFIVNPTSCEPSAITSTVASNQGALAHPSSPFQVGGCGDLGFKPNLNLHLIGGTKRGAHPALRALYRPRAGDANAKGIVVRLPRSAFLDQAHIRTICTRVQFAAKACPPGAQYGFIKAWTPLLDEPLEGPVWLRSSDHKLPDLVFDLHGQINVEASSRIDSIRGGVRATLESIPDAALSKVVLHMQGAKKGLIINSKNLCVGTNRANVGFTGHNGKQSSSNPVMKPECKRKHKRHRRA
jgi:hypothetical protein